MNKCPHCSESFNGYAEYHAHLAFSHLKPQDLIQSPFEEDKPLESNPNSIRTCSSGRLDLQKHEWKGYMPKHEKIRIVKSLEFKLNHAIIGLLLIAILGPWKPSFAEDCDNHCTPVVGPQGPVGPKGSTGATGLQGVSGANGTSGSNYSSTHFYGGLDLQLNLYNGKMFGVGLFNSTYAAPTDWSNVSGVSLSFNVGHDYTEDRINKLEHLVLELEKKIK